MKICHFVSYSSCEFKLVTVNNKMRKLTNFLCLIVLGVCALASPSSSAPFQASRESLNDLQPKLAAALEEWAKSHPDFDVKLKTIQSGTKHWSNNEGWINDLVIIDTSSSEWSANVIQRMDGSLRNPITLTKPRKTHSIILE